MPEVDYDDPELLSAHTFRFDERRRWFLLRSGNGVVLDDKFKLQVFDSPDAAREFALRVGRPFHQFDYYKSEPPDYDFVPLVDWLRNPLPETVNCHVFNMAWNLLNDICETIPWLTEPFRKYPYDVVYDKLFWGLNLPAVTPEGKHWTPVWRHSQVTLLRRVMRRTVLEFQRLLPPTASD